MPNAISAETREADAALMQARALWLRVEATRVRLISTSDSEKDVRNGLIADSLQHAETCDRLAELSRRAAKQDAAIAKMKLIVTAIKDADPDSRATLVERLIAAAREVVGGGA